MFHTRPGFSELCCVDGCTNYGSGQHALPTFNGDIVSNDWPGEYGCKSCCEFCYQKHERGEVPTCDHLYEHYLGV